MMIISIIIITIVIIITITGGVPGGKPLEARAKSNNIRNTRMVSLSGCEPRPHLWHASALTIAPRLNPRVATNSFFPTKFTNKVFCSLF